MMLLMRLRGGCLPLSLWQILRITILLVGGNGKGQVQQFACSGTAGHLRRFAGSTQPVIKASDDRIVAGGGERGQVQGCPQSPVARVADTGTLADARAGFAWHG